jgi:hypothetical protein
MMLVAVSALGLMSTGRVRAALAVLVWGTWVAVTGHFDVLRWSARTAGRLPIPADPDGRLAAWACHGVPFSASLTVARDRRLRGRRCMGLAAYATANSGILMYGLVQGACIVVALLLIVFLVRSYQKPDR